MNKKLLIPVSISTFLGIIFIINGIWLIMRLADFSVPFRDVGFVQILSVWFAAFASLYGGIHILSIKFRHKAVKSLL